MKQVIAFLIIGFLQISAKEIPYSDSKYTLLQHLASESISVYSYYLDEPSRLYEEVIVTFDNNSDTCVIASREYGNKYLDKLEINPVKIGNNRRGFRLTMQMREQGNAGEHGGYDVNKTVNEIWDIEEQKRLFSAINICDYRDDLDFYEYNQDTLINSTRITSDYSYYYDLNLSDSTILISNTNFNLSRCIEKNNGMKTCEQILYADEVLDYSLYKYVSPDHEEGIYTYDKKLHQFEKNR
jgi:hypothetical protein